VGHDPIIVCSYLEAQTTVPASKPPAALPPSHQGEAPPPRGHAGQALQLCLEGSGPQQEQGQDFALSMPQDESQAIMFLSQPVL
jgi:hypothetical protein